MYAQTGKNVKLSSFQGLFGKPVVVYFYPSDGSPGCTKQANAFKSSISSFKSKGAEGALSFQMNKCGLLPTIMAGPRLHKLHVFLFMNSNQALPF